MEFDHQTTNVYCVFFFERNTLGTDDFAIDRCRLALFFAFPGNLGRKITLLALGDDHHGAMIAHGCIRFDQFDFLARLGSIDDLEIADDGRGGGTGFYFLGA